MRNKTSINPKKGQHILGQDKCAVRARQKRKLNFKTKKLVMRNRKIILFILTVLICNISYGQFDKLKGTWISSSNDVMVINDTINTYYNSNMLCTSEKDEGMHFYLIDNTLSFQKQYYISPNHTKMYIDKYDFAIIKQTYSTLIVKPTSKLSKEFFKYRQSLKFIKQEYNVDETISFEKIIYHTTICFGTCPIIDLEIDSNKNVYLSGEFYKEGYLGIDSIKSGQFVGVLSDSLYNELLNILKTCNLRTLNFREADCCDGPITTLIIYYNGQRKYLKSMFPPTIADKLINFMYLLRDRAILTRTDEKRKIEK